MHSGSSCDGICGNPGGTCAEWSRQELTAISFSTLKTPPPMHRFSLLAYFSSQGYGSGYPVKCSYCSSRDGQAWPNHRAIMRYALKCYSWVSCMDAETPKRRSMRCPGCSRSLGIADVSRGRCWWCETKICIPKTYFGPAVVSAIFITIGFIVTTFSTFIKSFPLTMLWALLLFLVLNCSFWIGVLVSLLVSPPIIERIYANDEITRLRLDD